MSSSATSWQFWQFPSGKPVPRFVEQQLWSGESTRIAGKQRNLVASAAGHIERGVWGPGRWGVIGAAGRVGSPLPPRAEAALGATCCTPRGGESSLESTVCDPGAHRRIFAGGSWLPLRCVRRAATQLAKEPALLVAKILTGVHDDREVRAAGGNHVDQPIQHGHRTL